MKLKLLLVTSITPDDGALLGYSRRRRICAIISIGIFEKLPMKSEMRRLISPCR